MADKKQVAPWLARERQLYVEEWCLCGFHENGREYQRRNEETGQLEKLRVRHDGTDETTYTPIPEPIAPAGAEKPAAKAPKKARKQKQRLDEIEATNAAQAKELAEIVTAQPIEAPTVTDAA